MMNDNENSNVVDNLSLLINPVGACQLTTEQQLEVLEDAIGCSVCGFGFIYYKYDPLNFCPSCGAEVQE